MKNKGTTIAPEVKKKRRLYTYTWKSGKFYDYVKAYNITEATVKAVKQYMEGTDSKCTIVGLDILVKRGKHEVY